MKVISGLFRTYEDANDAVSHFLINGYVNENMSIVAQEEVLAVDDSHSDTADAAGKGAGVGGVIGLIAGAMPLVIPGIGPIISAGTILGGGLTGAGIGAAAGGLIGILQKWFGDEQHAEKVKESIQSGHILLAVETDETRAETVKEAMQDYGAYEVYEHEMANA